MDRKVAPRKQAISAAQRKRLENPSPSPSDDDPSDDDDAYPPSKLPIYKVDGVNRCDDFPPVRYQMLYQTPPDRIIHRERYFYTHF